MVRRKQGSEAKTPSQCNNYWLEEVTSCLVCGIVEADGRKRCWKQVEFGRGESREVITSLSRGSLCCYRRSSCFLSYVRYLGADSDPKTMLEALAFAFVAAPYPEKTVQAASECNFAAFVH